jgi:hypothetical protein
LGGGICHRRGPPPGTRGRAAVSGRSTLVALLEHIYSMFAEIEGRQVRLEPYGVAFTKMTARRLGANPVWYVDMTPNESG